MDFSYSEDGSSALEGLLSGTLGSPHGPTAPGKDKGAAVREKARSERWFELRRSPAATGQSHLGAHQCRHLKDSVCVKWCVHVAFRNRELKDNELLRSEREKAVGVGGDATALT